MTKDDSPTKANSLSVKDYLESAADASRRTRFITIAMIVASVLVLVSVLNSWDKGWITLRLAALKREKVYAIRQFPLLCSCDEGLDEKDCKLNPEDTKEVQYFMDQIAALKKEVLTFDPADSSRQAKTKANQEKIEAICKPERQKLQALNDALLKSAADTKYTVHVPFFGVAFDINDVGILGGIALLTVLVLLRLSLRSQIVSLRVGFKKAFACDEERDFYDVLAARQVFTFPPLNHDEQQVLPMQGWIERFWRSSGARKAYINSLDSLLRRTNHWRQLIEGYLKNKEQGGEAPKVLGPDEQVGLRAPQTSTSPDKWRANRNTALRIIPQFLSLLPAIIYSLQFLNDIHSSHYGFEMDKGRTWFLLIVESLLQLALFFFGLWCITKWNEVDKLWDYFEKHIRDNRKLGEPIQREVTQ